MADQKQPGDGKPARSHGFRPYEELDHTKRVPITEFIDHAARIAKQQAQLEDALKSPMDLIRAQPPARISIDPKAAKNMALAREQAELLDRIANLTKETVDLQTQMAERQAQLEAAQRGIDRRNFWLAITGIVVAVIAVIVPLFVG